MDPDYSPKLDDNRAAAEHKEWAVEFCVGCCDLFGESLDRMTLWDRIPSGLAVACVKCDDGDMDRFVSLVLEHIKSDAGCAARHPAIARALEVSKNPVAWRQGLVRYIASHSFATIAHARRAWEATKAARQDEKAGAK